jgi:hypothetical protein
VTLAKNYADADDSSGGAGGGIFVDTLLPASLEMVNTLVATNKLGDDSNSDCDGMIISGGTNLVRVADGCTGFVSTDLTGTNGSPMNAKLGKLRDRGGLAWVITFGVLSPAADAGNHAVCTSSPVNSFDQRAYSRIDKDGNEDGGADGNNCDIGAFERNAAPTLVFLPLLLR